jgi:hypothetical protein
LHFCPELKIGILEHEFEDFSSEIWSRKLTKRLKGLLVALGLCSHQAFAIAPFSMFVDLKINKNPFLFYLFICGTGA